MEGCPFGFTFLVVDPDAACLKNTSEMISASGGLVVAATGGLDALHIIWKRETEIDMILIEANLPDIFVYALVEAIDRMFDMPVVVMTSFKDDMGLQRGGGAKLHLAKPVSWRNIRYLCEFSYMHKKERGLIPLFRGSFPGESPGFGFWTDKESKIHYLNQSFSFHPLARQKTVWAHDLHDRFLRVVQIIAINDLNVDPEKVLEYMNAPCLTREHVLSHLQKYIFISRLERGRIVNAMTAEDDTDQHTGEFYYDYALGGPLLRWRRLKVKDPNPMPALEKRMKPGSYDWRVWQYNCGTSSGSGSNTSKTTPPPPPAEAQEDDADGHDIFTDEDDSTADDPEQN